LSRTHEADLEPLPWPFICFEGYKKGPDHV
jgi:hypothetical protein